MHTSTLYSSLFTVWSANQMLPLVKTIVSDLVEVSEEVQQTRDRLDQLDEIRMTEREADDYGDEVFSIEKNLIRRSERIVDFLGELTALNLMPGKESIDCVDFPAMQNDEPVCLCWKLGESSVRYWHRFDEDCSQRQPVDLQMIRQSGDHAII